MSGGISGFSKSSLQYPTTSDLAPKGQPFADFTGASKPTARLASSKSTTIFPEFSPSSRLGTPSLSEGTGKIVLAGGSDEDQPIIEETPKPSPTKGAKPAKSPGEITDPMIDDGDDQPLGVNDSGLVATEDTSISKEAESDVAEAKLSQSQVKKLREAAAEAILNQDYGIMIDAIAAAQVENPDLSVTAIAEQLGNKLPDNTKQQLVSLYEARFRQISSKQNAREQELGHQSLYSNAEQDKAMHPEYGIWKKQLGQGGSIIREITLGPLERLRKA